MRTLFLALALALSVPAVGCASLAPAVEQVKPRTAREALAVASVTFLGAVQLAATLHERGILNNEDATRVLAVFEEIDRSLVTANRLLAVGDEAGAERYANAALILLQELSSELTQRAQASRGNPA